MARKGLDLGTYIVRARGRGRSRQKPKMYNDIGKSETTPTNKRNTDSRRKTQGTEKGNKKENGRICLATWNVQSTWEVGALKVLAHVLKKYNIDVAAIQETKQRGVFINEIEDYVFYNSAEENRLLGVGFMIKKEIARKVVDFEAMSGRICRIRIRGQYRKITFVNVHAPTEEKTEEEKDVFYEKVEDVIGKIPNYDVKIILGDFNAKVGREEIFKNVTGGCSKHKDSNQNGQKLIRFAEENNMKIVSTGFEHKDIYKGTWVSPDGKTINQIDHCLIEKKHARTITDVRSCRGANIDSDHYMVKIKMKQVIPRQETIKGGKIKRYNAECLNEKKIAKIYESTMEEKLLNSNFEALNEINHKWNDIEKVFMKY